MDELTKLGQKYGTDKVGKHNYLPVYYSMFKDRQEEVSRVLEIGVAEGASLYMWKEFFPNAGIYGAEIDLRRVFSHPSKEIWAIEADQSSKKDIERLIKMIGREIDLVIDDGSHKLQDQIFSCLQFMSRLLDGVIYVIEDVDKRNIQEIVKALYHYDVKVFEVGERYDDVMIIVKHKNG